MVGTLRKKFYSYAAAIGLISPAIFLVSMLVILSLTILAIYSFTPKGSFGLTYYYKALFDPFYRGIILRTISIGLAVGGIITVFSYPLAYYLARNKSPYKVFLLALVISPMLTNLMVRTVAWMQILGGAGIVNRLLLTLNFIDAPIEFLGTKRAIIPALIYNFFPYMVLPLKAAVEAVDERLEEAAYTLGAGRFYTFIKVVVPQTYIGLFAGFSLVFLRTISAFATPKVLGQGKFFVLSTLIYQQMHSLNWGFAAALSFMLLVGILLIMNLTRRIQKGNESIMHSKFHNVVFERLTNSIGTFLQKVSKDLDKKIGVERKKRFAQKYKSPLIVDTKIVRAIVLLSLIFMILPLLLLIRSAFTSSELMGVNEGFTLRWVIEAVTDAEYHKAAILSLKLGLTSVLISIIIGTMAVFSLRRYIGSKHRFYPFLNWCLVSPLTLPAIALAVGLVLLFQLLKIPFSFNRLVLVHVLITLPYVVNNVGAAIANLDVSQEEAAFVLGASRLRILFSIILPALKTGIISAFIMAFIVSFDEVTITMFTSSVGQLTLPIKIMTDLDIVWSPKIAAVSLFLVGFSVLVLYVTNKTIGLEKFR